MLAGLSSASPFLPMGILRGSEPLPSLERLLLGAERHGTVAPVLDAIMALGQWLPAKWTTSQVEEWAVRVRRRDVSWWLRYERQRDEALGLLARAGFSAPLLMKGAALGGLLYRGPWQRPCGDLDLLVPAGELQACAEALEKGGYVANESPWVPRDLATGINVCRDGFCVELHSSLLATVEASVGYGELSSHQGTLQGPVGALMPSPSASIVVGVLHLVRHGYRFKMKDLADLDRLARIEGLDWGWVHQRLRGAGLEAALGVTGWLAQGLMRTPWPLMGEEAAAPPHWVKLIATPGDEGFWRLPGATPERVTDVLALVAASGGVAPVVSAARRWASRRLWALGANMTKRG